MAVRIKDVADKAGVSVATVSHVINGTKHVSDKKRTCIMEAINELSYTPNYLAKSLKENKSKVIGLVIPDISNYFFTEIATAIEHTLSLSGYNLLLCNSNEELELEIRHIKQLRSYMVSGMIIAPTTKDYDYRSLLGNADYPIIFIDRKLSNVQGDSISVDGAEAIEKAMDYLISKGHKSIGFIGAQTALSTTEDRFAGYKQALEKHGIAYNPRICGFGKAKIVEAREICKKILSEDKVTALIVSSSLMSFGAMQFLSDYMIKIPDEIAIIGYDDYIWSTITTPPMSTISQPTKEIGEKAAKLILERIKNPEKDIENIVLNAKLIIRQSC